MLPEVSPVPDERADETDFATWVATRGDALQRFAYLVTGNAVDAPDLVQDALARAYPRWRWLASQGTAEAYVRKSIVNGSVSRWRKTRRLVSVAELEAYAATTPDGSTDVDDADEAWELCRTLPSRQRAAVVLRFYEDLSYAQIALILDCAEPSARSLVHRALESLRERLNQGGDHD